MAFYKRTRKSKGGRLIGKGASGWVFSPPIKCIGGKGTEDYRSSILNIPDL